MKTAVSQRLAGLRAFFDAAAGTWDATVRVEPEKLAPILGHAALRPGDRVLDVGCGTGVLIPHLLRLTAPDGYVFALDLSERMLEECRRKHEGQRLSFLLGAAEQIPLPENACTVAVCFSAFPHFPDKPAALAEIARVLRPGGRVVVAHAAGREAVNGMHVRIGGAVGHDLLPPADEMERLLLAAGLANPLIVDGDDEYVATAVKP